MRHSIDKIVRNTVRHDRLRRVFFWIAASIGIIWAAPLTLLGVMLALPVLMRHGHIQKIAYPVPALLISGPLADRMLEHHPFGPMCAMATGHIVIIGQQWHTRRIVSHELAHVQQAARWGILFPIVYLLASAWAVARGGHVYWHNSFEVAARAAEQAD